MASCRGKKTAKNANMVVASIRARKGKMMQYLRNVPSTHVGNRYQFQFQGSGGAEVKHRKKESSINELAASHNKSDVSNNVALQIHVHAFLLINSWAHAVLEGYIRGRQKQHMATVWWTEEPCLVYEEEALVSEYGERTGRLSGLDHNG